MVYGTEFYLGGGDDMTKEMNNDVMMMTMILNVEEKKIGMKLEGGC